MAIVTTQSLSLATDLVPTYYNAAASQTFRPGDKVFLHVKASTVTVTLTVDDPNSVSPSGANTFDPDVALVVTTLQAAAFVGPFPASRFAQTNGYANLSWSTTGGASIAVLSL